MPNNMHNLLHTIKKFKSTLKLIQELFCIIKNLQSKDLKAFVIFNGDFNQHYSFIAKYLLNTGVHWSLTLETATQIKANNLYEIFTNQEVVNTSDNKLLSPRTISSFTLIKNST